jgi:hypothetical protein
MIRFPRRTAFFRSWRTDGDIGAVTQRLKAFSSRERTTAIITPPKLPAAVSPTVAVEGKREPSPGLCRPPQPTINKERVRLGRRKDSEAM